MIRMMVHFPHRALNLAFLGCISAALGTTFLDINYGSAPQPGAYLVLTGLWFGLVIGFAVWRWGTASLMAVAMAIVTTWLAWEAAVNVAMQIDRPWPQAIDIAKTYKSYVTGFVAGAVGALLTWAGAAAHLPELRNSRVAATVTATGALFGLLFPATDIFDSGLVLLLPWQAAVAAIIGVYINPSRAREESVATPLRADI
jgi:hypothetical protein